MASGRQHSIISGMIPAPKPAAATDLRFQVPAWAKRSAFAGSEAEAAFLCGAALLALDRVVRADPPWAGVWRQRQALKCAAVAVRMSGRREAEAELRDAWVLRRAGDEAGPSGNIYGAWKRLGRPRLELRDDVLKDLAASLGLPWTEGLDGLADRVAEAKQQTVSAPHAMAAVLADVGAVGPDYEILGWWIADLVLRDLCGWPVALPLAMGQRYSAQFRAEKGAPRPVPGSPDFVRGLCLALVDGVADALRLAAELDRRSAHLLAVAPKLRAKGAGEALDLLLGDDAVPGSLTTPRLSRFASRRLFDRLLALDAVRELSGRSNFRVFGL